MAEYYTEDGGVHFDPDNDELIKEYLIPRSLGEPCRYGGFIVDMDVYATEPWLLDHTNNPFFKENEWYYFATRTQVAEKNLGFAKNSKRKIADGGSWKANVKTYIKDRETGHIIGVKRNLTYTRSNNNNSTKKKQKREDGTCCCCCAVVPGSDSSWIMDEFMLPEGDEFQKVVLCKIREVKNSSKKKDHHREASSSGDHHQLWSSSHSSQPLVCGGNGPEIPHMSLAVSAAETEGNREQSGQGNMARQIDWFEAFLMSDTEDQQQPAISEDRKHWDLEALLDNQQQPAISACLGEQSDHHLGPSSSSEQHPINVDHESVLASSSSEQQQQPLVCRGNGPEIPHMSLAVSAAETERNRAQSGQGNMVHRIDEHSLIETVPAIEGTHEEAEEDLDQWAVNLEADLMTNTEDQQQPTKSAPSHMNVVSPAHLGDKSPPVVLDESSKEKEDLDAVVLAFTRGEEDAPSLQWMDHDQLHPPICTSSHMNDLSLAHLGIGDIPLPVDLDENLKEYEHWTTEMLLSACDTTLGLCPQYGMDGSRSTSSSLMENTQELKKGA